MRIVRAPARTMAHGTAAPVVREEGLGRCAAEAVLGGVVPLRVLGRLVQRMEEADHGVRAPVWEMSSRYELRLLKR